MLWRFRAAAGVNRAIIGVVLLLASFTVVRTTTNRGAAQAELSRLCAAGQRAPQVCACAVGATLADLGYGAFVPFIGDAAAWQRAAQSGGSFEQAMANCAASGSAQPETWRR